MAIPLRARSCHQRISGQRQHNPYRMHSGLDRLSSMSYISVMTEITIESSGLPPAIEQFVLRWGDMGGQWGVNRSVAQIHALLYVSERPLPAEDMADALGMARSNVSNSMRELLAWILIRRVPVLGDRRDHYEAETDLWQMVSRIAQGRKEREIDPAVVALRHVLDAAGGDPRVGKAARARLHALQDVVATVGGWYALLLTVPPAMIMALSKLGSTVGILRSFGRGKSS